MPLKVTWKKGMRLSTDVFDALDVSIDENLRLSNILSTGGRFGLIPTKKPFELSINVSNNIVEVVSLSCHGVTKSGKIVDIEFDSNFTCTFDARVSLPQQKGDNAFLLVIKLHDKQWREVDEMYSEPKYSFELIGENCAIDSDSLPIGLLVNQFGWRLDETEFVPPCLYINAHPMFIDQAIRAKLVLKSISDKCQASRNCVARHLLGTIWPAVEYNCINIDKSQETLTPAALFASLQKVVAAFVIGCSIEERITLENADPFIAYRLKPYNLRNIFRDIKRGLELCSEISAKMDAVCAMTAVREMPEAAPQAEKPKPKTHTPPAPKPVGKNIWDGKII